METQMKKMPTPQERPDLYDDFDGTVRPAGQGTGVKTPDYIQKLMDQSKRAKKSVEVPK